MLVNGTIDQQVDLEQYLEDIGVKNTKKVRNPMPKNYVAGLTKLSSLLI